VDYKNAAVLTSEGPPKDEEFELWGIFHDVVPIDGETPVDEAQHLNSKVAEAIHNRLNAFCRLLNLVLRQSNLEPWQHLDIALLSLATALEGAGVDGAFNVIRFQAEEVTDLAGGNGSRD